MATAKSRTNKKTKAAPEPAPAATPDEGAAPAAPARARKAAGRKKAAKKSAAKKSAAKKAPARPASADAGGNGAAPARAPRGARAPKDVDATGKNLVIVESPTKSRTLNKFLGRDFAVMASYGHIMDLPKSKLGVDIENGFEPQYEP